MDALDFSRFACVSAIKCVPNHVHTKNVRSCRAEKNDVFTGFEYESFSHDTALTVARFRNR